MTDAQRSFLSIDNATLSEAGFGTVRFGSAPVTVQLLPQERKRLKTLLDIRDEEKFVTIEDFSYALKRVAKGKFFDDELTKDIYKHAKSTTAGNVSWRAILDAVTRMREGMLSQLRRSRNELEMVTSQKSYCNLKLREIAGQPGTADEPRLISQIVSINFSDPNEINVEDFYRICITCGDKCFETMARQPHEGKVICNDIFTMPYAQPGGMAELQVVSENRACTDPAERDFIGDGHTKLDGLEEQTKISQVVTFGGGSATGTIDVNFQWIQSQKSFYTKNGSRLSAQEAVLVADVLHQEERFDFFEHAVYGRSSSKLRSGDATVLDIMKAAVTEPAEFVDWSVASVLQKMNTDDMDKGQEIYLLICLFASCLASVTRVLYLDALIEGYALWCTQAPKKRWSSSVYLKCILAILLSLAFDGYWIYQNFLSLRFPDSGLAHLTKVMTFVNMGVKLLLILFFVKARKELSEQQTIEK